MQKTSIDYLTHTWNPLAMCCAPVSEGCEHCWHLRMADRLAEYDEAFPNQPPIGAIVSLKNERGKIISIKHGPYAWLLNYRHPDQEAINAMRGRETP